MISGFMEKAMLVPSPCGDYPQKIDPRVAERLQNQRDARSRETGGQRSRDDRFQAESDHFGTAFRAHGAQAADHDAEAAEVGETAQRIRQQETAALRKLGQLG